MPAQAVTAAPLPAQLFSVAVSSPGLNGLDQSILENNQFILNMKKIQNFPIILEKWGSLGLFWRIESSVENDKMTVDDFLMSQIWTVTQI